MPSNEESIDRMRNRARSSVMRYAPNEDLETGIMDLVASLHHVYDSLEGEREHESWNALLERANMHYVAERFGEE